MDKFGRGGGGRRGGRGGRGGRFYTGIDKWREEMVFAHPNAALAAEFREESQKIAVQKPSQANCTIDIPACLKVIEENDVSFITSETGSGKSTVIPFELAVRFPDAMILVTEPRRISAIQLATRVANLLDVKLGEEVGYSVRGEHCGTLGQTRIMYITSYSLLLYLIREPPNRIPFDFIIMDEFHERPLDIQVSAMLIRELICRKQVKENFKLLLSSATVGGNLWRKYFELETLRIGEYSQCKELFPIREMFAEEVCDLCGVECKNLVSTLDAGKTELVGVTSRIYHVLTRVSRLFADCTQSILIFLPGRAQVEEACSWIVENYASDYYPVMWHGEIELSVIEEALEKDCSPRRKVYLATDIAEVSLTLPDVVLVIDACLNKRRKINYNDPASVAFPPLRLFWETENNAHQRRGRVGRVRNGIYMSMITETEHKGLSKATGREYDTGDLDTVVLHSLFISGDPVGVLNKCCEPPNSKLVEYVLMVLHKEGYLFSAAADAGKKTFEMVDANARQCFGSFRNFWTSVLSEKVSYGVSLKGFIIAHVPVLLEASTMVYYGCLLGIADSAALLASTAAAMFPFSTPFDHNRERQRREVHKVVAKMTQFMSSLMKASEPIANDLLASVSAVLTFMHEQREGRLETEEHITKWCEDHFLLRSRLLDAVGIYEQMVERLGGFLPIHGKTEVKDVRHAAKLLHIICIAANISRTVEVVFDEGEAAAARYNGDGLVIPFRCCKNDGSPTICPWMKDDVCTPLNLSPGQDKYFGSLTAEATRMQVYMIMALLTYTVEHTDNHGGKVWFRITKTVDHLSKKIIVLECEEQLADKILTARLLMRLKLRVIHAQLKFGDDVERASSSLEESCVNFPEEWVSNPELFLQSIPLLMEKLVFQTSAQQMKQVRNDAVPTTRWNLTELDENTLGDI